MHAAATTTAIRKRLPPLACHQRQKAHRADHDQRQFQQTTPNARLAERPAQDDRQRIDAVVGQHIVLERGRDPQHLDRRRTGLGHVEPVEGVETVRIEALQQQEGQRYDGINCQRQEQLGAGFRDDQQHREHQGDAGLRQQRNQDPQLYPEEENAPRLRLCASRISPPKIIAKANTSKTCACPAHNIRYAGKEQNTAT